MPISSILQFFSSPRAWIILLLAVALCSGCARSQYRRAADAEAYTLIRSRQSDPLWELPCQRVEPHHESRMYVAAERDLGSKPSDDPVANGYMRKPYGFNNQRYYSRIPEQHSTENPTWMDRLPRREDGKISLTQTLAVDLALVHSRDYQSQFESVYLDALALSGNRFEFDAQWFGGSGADFTATGPDTGNVRSLSATAARLGFSRNLASGGQFATNMLNSLVWDFGAGNFQAGSAALVATFTQPLLRGAFRHVRLESLTQSERDLLYSVRDFARFRRTFYVDVVSSYLNLLTQVQALRNLQTNVDNLNRNLVEHEFYVQLEMVSQVQRDLVFQQYQNGRLSLLASQQNLTASLDNFKFQLGLPAWVPLEIDESFLDPFELVNPQLVELQDATQLLYEDLVQYLPPAHAPQDFLLDKYDEFVRLREQVVELLPSVQEELQDWLTRLNSIDESKLTQDDQLDIQQQRDLADRIQTTLTERATVLADRQRYYDEVNRLLRQYDADVDDDPLRDNVPPAPQLNPPGDTANGVAASQELPEPGVAPQVLAWEAVMQAIGEQLREEISELYVAQTQVRLFLIDIEPRPIDQHRAITYALTHRLDLMNSRAEVTDAFRRVEVAADALQSDLSISGSVEIGSDAGRNNAFRLDSGSNRYTAGVEFDGPLNRLNERNAYRSSQIAYQRASRNFIADRDQVANEVRFVLRQLELARLNFQIARQQLVAATRQVDQAQIDLRRSLTTSSNLTLVLLEALEGMLSSRNNLISNWVNYRIQKMRLFTALEMLYLDDRGAWLNETTGLDELEKFKQIDRDYFPSGWIPELDDFDNAGEILPNQAVQFDELPSADSMPPSFRVDPEDLAPEAATSVMPELTRLDL